MTPSEAQDLLDRINYKRPGWHNVKFLYDSGLEQVTVTASCSQRLDPTGRVFFRVPITPVHLRASGADSTPTRIELVHAVLIGTLWLEEHEVLENLTLDDEPIFIAHKDNFEAESLYLLSCSIVERSIAGYGPKMKHKEIV